MGTLNFPGLATGIDTTEIVQQLMAIKSRPLANYQVKQMDIEQKQSALSELKGLVSQFQSAASALADSDKLEVFSTSSNDRDRLSVGAPLVVVDPDFDLVDAVGEVLAGRRPAANIIADDEKIVDAVLHLAFGIGIAACAPAALAVEGFHVRRIAAIAGCDGQHGYCQDKDGH